MNQSLTSQSASSPATSALVSLMQPALACLETHSAELTRVYAEVVSQYLSLNEAAALEHADQTVQVLMQRLIVSKPLISVHLKEAVTNLIGQGKTVAQVVATAQELAEVFNHYLLAVESNGELELAARQELTRRARSILNQHVTNVRLLAVNAMLEEYQSPLLEVS